MKINNTLFIIPARGGSKGLPRKNIIRLAGKPLIYYTIDAARGVTTDENICVTSDDPEIIQTVEKYGLRVPFVRPVELATDTAGSREVILHAVNYFENELGKNFSEICLLQPTSPLRSAHHILEAYGMWDDSIDMVVSVKESKANPYFNLFEENQDGFLVKSKNSNYTRRQDAPKAWEYNGAIYIIKVQSIKKKEFSEFVKIKKYIMCEENSVDIDNIFDLKLAQLLIKNRIVRH